MEQVVPYVTEPSPPDLPVKEAASDELQRCRQVLVSQLRAYRGEYQSVMAAARASLTERLRQAGIAVAEAE